MKLRFGARTDVGLSRQVNEDCYLVDEGLGLYMIADGMGGSVGGEVASRMACDEVRYYLTNHRETLQKFVAGNAEVQPKDVCDLLAAAIQQAGYAIFERARQERQLGGMGTTVAALLAIGEHLFIGHVGDSRVYLLRGGQLHQLTRDHSLVEELKKLGKISNSDQVKARYRNAITRAVGIYENVQVDTLEVMPLPNDRFILCSDGLHSTATDADLVRLVGEVQPDEGAENLIRHANSKGGRDNVTVIVVDVLETEPLRAELTQKKLSALKSVPLFKFFSFDELLRVVAVVQERRFAAEEIVFNEDDTDDALFIMLSGQVEVRKRGVLITTLKAGDHFGELALIDRFPRSATVKCIQPTFCLVISRANFYDLIREYSALSVKLLWCLARVCCARLRETTDELGLARSLVSKVQIPSAGDEPFSE